MPDEHKDADAQTGVVVEAGPQGDTDGSANGTGKVTDVGGGFTSTMTKWTTASGDPFVSASFLLGWRMGLAHSWATDSRRTAWPDDDPGLDDDERWSVLTGQIASAAKKLTGGDAAALPQRAPSNSDPEDAQQASRAAIEAARTDLLQALYVQDHFRGMAFTLGGQLEALCIDGGADPLARGIPEVSKPLLALATSLPPNAAHSVLNSLALWAEQLKHHKAAFDAEQLRRQGGIWRSILAGDVAARDLLHLSDYVGTAEQVVARLHEFALKALRRHLLVPALVALIFLLGGLALLLFSHKTAAGASSVVAALGLSWKGIGQYLGKAAAKGEQAMWNAQIDWTIAYRATISLAKPSPVPRRRPWARLRRTREPARQRRESHYATWQQWLDSWPDFELDR